MLATANLTDGGFELIHDTREAGSGPAPHVHRLSDEAFYVLEGRFMLVRGHDEIEAGPGSFVFVRRGTRHSYRALESGSRVLVLYAPAGLEPFLRAEDKLLATGESAPDAIAALRGKFDADPVP